MEALLWKATLPVSAAQQRPLFDAEREATEALDTLDEMQPAELLRLLMHTAVDAVLAMIEASRLTRLVPRAPELLARLRLATTGEDGRPPDVCDGAPPPRAEWQLAALEAIAQLEEQLHRAASLEEKLPGAPEVVRALLVDERLETEVEVPPARFAARAALQRALSPHSKEDSHERPPDLHEFILRARAARPVSVGAVPTAHRMYVALHDGQWRLAVALSTDGDG